jgi:hypothetical protein
MSTEDRDVLYEVGEAQKGSLNDVWVPFSAQDWNKAELLFVNHLLDRRFLEYLRRASPSEEKAGHVIVSMRREELREALTRFMAKRTAQLLIEDSQGRVPTPAHEAFQERVRLAISAAERALQTLGPSRHQLQYVVVDSESGSIVAGPTPHINRARDEAEITSEPT